MNPFRQTKHSNLIVFNANELENKENGETIFSL